MIFLLLLFFYFTKKNSRIFANTSVERTRISSNETIRSAQVSYDLVERICLIMAMHLHTNEAQGQRYWPHMEKFTGTNGNFLAFIYELIKQIGWTKENSREGTRIWKIQERTIKYLTLIYNYNLASKKEIQESERVTRFREAIREIPLPSHNSSSKKTVKRKVKRMNENGEEVETEITVDVTSDIEEPEEKEKPGSWPAGWIENKDEREVGAYLLKIVEASIDGTALEVVVAMGNPKDRNGFLAIERLADVYGRNASHIAMMPQLFVWGTGNNLPHDWNNYKMLLDSSQYAKLHPGNQATMIWAAMYGFTHYQHYHRLHDHVRVHCGENGTWEEFKKAVDEFIGDIHRYNFQQSMIKNENGVAVMSASGVVEKSGPIFGVGNMFKPNGKKGNGLAITHKTIDNIKNNKNKKNKNKQDSNASQSTAASANQNDLNSPKAQNDKPKEKHENKKGARQCAWCGDTSHKFFHCKTHGNGKWKDRVCNRCGGKGHPPETCSNPPKGKEENKK